MYIYYEYIASDVKETVARGSGIHKSVDGIAGTRSFVTIDLSVYLWEFDK